jgi:hypothetical protein
VGDSEPDSDRLKRAVAFVVAVAFTALLVGLALWLGAWARRTRSDGLHRGRLERLLEKKPLEDQVTRGLEDEGMRAVGVAHTPEERAVLAERWGGTRRDAVVEDGRPWATTRAFATDDIVYFIHFDAHGTMRAFTLAHAGH